MIMDKKQTERISQGEPQNTHKRVEATGEAQIQVLPPQRAHGGRRRQQNKHTDK